jgi:Micrococcal nuclease (thermonuclease) homologs
MAMVKNRFFKVLAAVIGTVAIATLTSGCYEILEIIGGEDPKEPEDVDIEGPYEVDRVVDGDTLIVNIDGERTRVRLIGVNTPESVAEDESRNTEEGVAASNYVKELIDQTGFEVWLEYDNERYDQYDRTLAYVYIDYEGELVMLERILIEEGYAEPVLYGENDRYYVEFCELVEDAS